MIIDQLLTYERLHEDALECVQVGQVKFKQDFGPWKAGDELACIAFDFVQGIAQAFDADDKKIGWCEFTLLPTAWPDKG